MTPLPRVQALPLDADVNPLTRVSRPLSSTRPASPRAIGFAKDTTTRRSVPCQRTGAQSIHDSTWRESGEPASVGETSPGVRLPWRTVVLPLRSLVETANTWPLTSGNADRGLSCFTSENPWAHRPCGRAAVSLRQASAGVHDHVAANCSRAPTMAARPRSGFGGRVPEGAQTRGDSSPEGGADPRAPPPLTTSRPA